MKHISSSITTLGKIVETPTGTDAGEHGAATGSSLAPSSSSAPAIVERLISNLPGGTVLALQASLERQNGLMVSMRSTANGPEVSIAPVAEMTPNYEAAAEAVRLSLTPPSEPMIVGWLVELDAITAKRSGSGADDDARLAAYRKRLSEYPADVVKHVLQDIPRKWWPTWSELHEVLEKHTAPRRMAVTRLRAAAHQATLPAPKQFIPASDEAKARHQSMIDQWRSEVTPKPEPLTEEEILAKYAGLGPSPELLAQQAKVTISRPTISTARTLTETNE